MQESSSSKIYSVTNPTGENFNLATFEIKLRDFVPQANGGDLSVALLKEADYIFEKNKGSFAHKSFSDVQGKDAASKGATTYYADLVQEGGGMLGIALAGYTYILEKAGIRFASLAGTSAGAINAMGMAALPDEVYSAGKTKSEYLAYIIANYDFGQFMDPDRKWKRVIIRFLTNKWFVAHYKISMGLLLILLLLFSYGLYSFFNWCIVHSSALLYFITGTATFIIVSAGLYLFLYLFMGKKTGVNKGTVFRNWMGAYLDLLGGIRSTKDLEDKFNAIQISDGQTEDKIRRRLVMITADLTNARIVKFPERAVRYFKTPDRVNPAAYVRASMSIPFFFERFEPDGQNSGSEMEMQAVFADGGMLSNFPIREFHNTTRAVPRYPTFGVKLGVEAKANEQTKKMNLLKYIGALIFTFRNFYDNDFLHKNKEYKKLIAFIDIREIDAKGKRGNEVNWLDFNMDNKTKTFLFNEGAKAACKFLSEFDWEAYKATRQEIYGKQTQALK